MKKFVFILLFIVMLAIIIVPYTNLTLPDPVPLKVAAGDTQIPADVVSYCGEGFVKQHCENNYEEVVNAAESIEVSPGTTLTFSFEIPPDDLKLSRENINLVEEDSRVYLDDDKREIEVPEEPGIYYYFLDGSWSEKNRWAIYFFSVEVK